MFREVPMVEVREVLRLRQMGYGLRRTAALLGLDRITVHRGLGDGLDRHEVQVRWHQRLGALGETRGERFLPVSPEAASRDRAPIQPRGEDPVAAITGFWPTIWVEAWGRRAGKAGRRCPGSLTHWPISTPWGLDPTSCRRGMSPLPGRSPDGAVGPVRDPGKHILAKVRIWQG